jgi:uncharacterized membrane protein
MTLANLLLLLFSACIHVVAHVGMRRTQDRSAFVWWMLLWSVILYSPVVLIVRTGLNRTAWICILISSIFEAVYFLSIARAYQHGDLSVVYPLARGSAPAILLIWSTLVLREAVTPGGVLGVLAIVCGLYLTNLPSLGAWREPLRRLRSEGPRWALLAGLGTSLYTAVDKVGVSYAVPILYTYVAVCVTWAWLTPFALLSTGWKRLSQELSTSRYFAPLAGFTTIAAYALVLVAMQRGTPASYAGAIREVSVVIAAATGVLVFREASGRLRIAGSLLVALGVGLIGLLG